VGDASFATYQRGRAAESSFNVTPAWCRALPATETCHRHSILSILQKPRAGAFITDASITHDKSRGPLFNAKGEVVAINTFDEKRGDTQHLQ
jgi:hypothetical protein